MLARELTHATLQEPWHGSYVTARLCARSRTNLRYPARAARASALASGQHHAVHQIFDGHGQQASRADHLPLPPTPQRSMLLQLQPAWRVVDLKLKFTALRIQASASVLSVSRSGSRCAASSFDHKPPPTPSLPLALPSARTAARACSNSSSAAVFSCVVVERCGIGNTLL
jgi:hypothetical protein